MTARLSCGVRCASSCCVYVHYSTTAQHSTVVLETVLGVALTAIWCSRAQSSWCMSLDAQTGHIIRSASLHRVSLIDCVPVLLLVFDRRCAVCTDCTVSKVCRTMRCIHFLRTYFRILCSCRFGGCRSLPAVSVGTMVRTRVLTGYGK